jgi:hypothetical protein
MAAISKALEGVEAQLTKAGIHYKINQIMEEVGVIKKMRSEGVKYAYQAWDDVVPALNEALVKFGVTLTFTETPPIFQALQVGKTEVIVGMTIRATDSDSGEFAEVTKYGAATYYNPQAYQAAGTYAYKYAMLKMFLIPCKEDQDPDSIVEQKAPAKAKTAEAPKAPETIKDFFDKSGAWTKEQSAQIKQAASGTGVYVAAEATRLMEEAKESGAKNWADVINYLDGDLKS